MAADPATAVLATVAAEPATAELAAVAADPATAVLAVVDSESTTLPSKSRDLTTELILGQGVNCLGVAKISRAPMAISAPAHAAAYVEGRRVIVAS